MFKFIVSLLLVCSPAKAGLPPTTATGQSESTKTTTFFFQAPYNQFTTTSSSQRRLETGNQNFLVNPSFEASGGASSIPGWTCALGNCSELGGGSAQEGLLYGRYTNASSTASPIVEQSVTPTVILEGQTLQASIWTQTAATDFQFCVLIAGSESQCQVIPATTSGYTQVSAYFTAISGQSIGLRIKNTNAGPVSRAISVDNAFLGPYNSTGASSINTLPVAWTPTFTGIGTAAGVNCTWQRVGNLLVANCTFTAGTVTGTTFSLTLPNSYTTVAGLPTISSVGAGTGSSTGDSAYFVYAAPSSNLLQMGIRDASNAGLTPCVGSGCFITGQTVSIFFQVPILGWSPIQTLTAAQLSNSWSGYHDNTCSWAHTGTSYADPTADATCVLVQRQNSNFGTVTTYGGASPLPGIIFTPNLSGIYYICATPKIVGATLAATLDVRLWDGTTTVAESEETAYVAADEQQMTICGLINASANVSKTMSLQTKATSGAITIQTNSTNASAVEWSIFPVTGAFPQPFIPSAVVNGGMSVSKSFDFIAAGATRVTACSAASCTIYDNTGPSGVSVANASSVYMITVPAGTCSSTNLVCSCSSGGGSTCLVAGTNPTSTTSVLGTVNTSGVATNGYLNIHCGCL